MLLSSNALKQEHFSELAKCQNQAWEQILSMRISLQRVVDITNKIPNKLTLDGFMENDENVKVTSNNVKDSMGYLVDDLLEVLEMQTKDKNNLGKDTGTKKRKRDSNPSWEKVISVQNRLLPYWKKVINSHHARHHFGSEELKSKLKVFNQTIWDQITSTIDNDPERALQRSRMPISDCPKLIGEKLQNHFKSITTPTTAKETSSSSKDKLQEEEDGDDIDVTSNSAKKMKREFNEEIYDDRTFYAMLLKSFVSAASDSTVTSQGEVQEALRRHKSSKIGNSNTDRRASKGRKIRYVAHKKLENFMFPIPTAVSLQDTARLFASLFR